MANKAKIRGKQAVRDEKLFDSIVYGNQKIGIYGDSRRPAQSNRKGGLPPDTDEDEMAAGYVRLLRYLLPGILAKLSSIKDPRNEKKCDHTIATIILYGLIMFLSHTPSRRAANRDIGGSNAYGLLNQIMPDLKTMPHADTLARLLGRVDADGIEKCYEMVVAGFIRSKAFLKLNPGHCLIAIDGTQKYSRRYCFDKRALVRNKGDAEKENYYVYALESAIILNNGLILPLFTEFLENDGRELEGASKQDCELKGFARLAEKIAKVIGKGRATLVIDGLYANGPVVSRCMNYGWDYMITLKRGSLTTVWEDFDGLRKCEPENTLAHQSANGRDQEFHWSNGIEYTYGGNSKRLKLNVVACTEKWVEGHPRSGGVPAEKVCEYAWLSSAAVKSENVIGLCNNKARKRWYIENHFHTEKHQGYNYSHCYSYNWEAMKGFHSLMKFAHFINALIAHSQVAQIYVKSLGVRWFIRRIWMILTIRGLGSEEGHVIPLYGMEIYNRLNFRCLKLAP
jgi:hypothetical protein